ncbi:MAG: DUF29 domain-containing protein [Hydrococcus sp. Prado102]|jgi:hypothetical protein|nr:DUF29 domain-containing protein [Hydrococcus sp. Prado102]
MVNSLYERDFQQWLIQTKTLLQERKFESIDIEHLVEELEYLGKSDKKALLSNLKILLAHLIKLQVQHDAPSEMKSSWYRSVDEHRIRVLDDLDNSPSLKSYLETALVDAYPSALCLAIKEGKRASFGVKVPQLDEYPENNPFSIEQILDEEFYP